MQLDGRRLAATVAVLIVVSACAAPLTGKGKGGPSPVSEISPTSAPSPTPAEPLKATGPAFHGGEVGVAYAAVALSATGGVQPYKWSILSGALPPGMSISNDGSVAGTPTGAGHFSFAVQVADAASSTAGFPADITIAPPLTLGLIGSCAQYCNVELGCDSTCGPFGQLSGGVGPFTYSMTGGQLPSGMSLNGLTLSGTFKGQTGWLQFTVQVSDSLGGTATVSPRFWMYDHLSFAGGSIAACPWPGAGPNDPGCTAQFPFSGGTPNSGTVSAAASWVNYTCNYLPACTNPPNPPPMPTITVGGGLITVAVPRGYSCQTCGTSGYKGTLAITLTNQDTCSAGPTKCSATANVTITQASG